MKFFRKSLFWVIALVVLGGAFFLVDERVDVADRAREANLRLFSFQPEDVSEFWIRNTATGLFARVVRDGDGWRLKEPLSAKGDAEAISKILENVVKARKDAVLFENPDPAKLKELGFDEARQEMAFRTANGSTVIRFGNMGPTHNVSYAMLNGDDRVYRIHSDVRREADAKVYALRDKTVLSFDPVKLRRLTLHRKDKGTVAIVHDDRGRWDMAEPEPARASMTRVLETLYKIRNAEVKEFIDEAPSGLARYGLDTPRIRVSIVEKGGGKAQVLSIGARDRKRRGYFATTGRAANVFLIEEDVVNALRADADKWKDSKNGA